MLKNKIILYLFFFVFLFLFSSVSICGATVNESGTISQDTVWTSDEIHLVTGDITINAGIKLTINPGTVVKFNPGRRIDVNQGILVAEGDPGSKIVFTSCRDDSFGGDTNGDGYSHGQPGDWSGIRFNRAVSCNQPVCETGEAGTRLSHCIIRYGGYGDNGTIYANRSDISIISCEISYGSYYGVSADYSSLLIQETLISDNVNHGLYQTHGSPEFIGNTIRNNGGSGIHVLSAAPVIEGNTITGNTGWGIYFNEAQDAPLIAGNTITGNTRSMIIPASALPVPDAPAEDENILAPNGVNGIWIRGNGRNTNLDFKRLYAGEPHEITTYQVYGTLTMNAGATLTVAPGVMVKFAQGGGLTIHGALDAQGGPELPVVFTSYRDDRYGGDLNLDGYVTTPVNGDWGSIYFSDQAMDENCIIDHAVIRYGGSSNNGMIYSSNTDFTIKNSVLSNSSANGIRGYQANLTLTGTEIFGNMDNGIYLDYSGTFTITNCRIFANLGNGLDTRYYAGINISDSEIFGNVGNGVYNTSNQTVNADGNWWGAADGPGGQGPGSGDRISANVTCESFLTSGTEFSYFNAGPNTGEGTLTGPAVTRGTDSSEFGTDDRTRMLYDLESVILDYSGLDPAWRYEIFVTHANGDDTTGVGGNRQSLTDGDGLVIQGDFQVPGAASPAQYHFPLAPSSHDDGTLQLNFNRENGYRAVVSQVWLVRRGDTSDSAAPGSAITSPSPEDHLAGSFFEVTGTSTDGSGCGVKNVEIGIGQGGKISWRPVTHLSANGAWQYRWPLPEDGGYMLYSRARDRAGNLEPPGAGLNVTVNNTPPVPVTGLSVYDTPTDSGGNISMVWSLSPDDGAGDNDVKSYGIERSQAPNGGFTPLGSVLAGSTEYTDNTPVNGTRYYYRVVSVDTAGNKSYSPVYGPVISIVNTGDTIPPEEIDGLSGIPGNEVVFLTWSPSADSALDLTDQLLEVSTDNINWNSPVSLGKETASYLVQGLTNDTDYYFRIRVKDASNNTSEGIRIGPVTPRATAVTTVSGTLASDTTWASGVYYVENSLTVNQGVTLTILPGVIVKFASSRYIRVNGTLHAVGSAGNEIIFTAWTDDAHGGDSNGDGESQGSPGYWSYLSLADTASASRLDHVIVQFAGYGSNAAIYNHSDAPVVSCRIRENAARGIQTDNSSPLIQGNIIENNGGDGVFHSSGSPRVQGNVISGNNNGIYTQYATPAIHDNNITGNREYGICFRNAVNAPEITGNTITGNDKPVRLPFSSLPGPGAGNILGPNTHDQIEFWGNTLTRSVTLGADQANVYYQVGGDATIASGVRLTMDPGVIWKFGNALSLYVRGALHAVGTPGEKVIFTSHGDDSAGGDTNGDGFSEGRPGDWRRIYFADSVIDFMARLEHATVRYGGAYGYANVYAEKASISIVSSEISHSANYGIYFYNGSPLVRDTRVSDNKDLGICQYYGSPVFRGNTVTGNGNSGLYLQHAPAVIADNTITNNAGWGIYFYDAQDAPPITGNTVTGNTRSMIIPASALPGPDTPAEDENILAPNSVDGIWIRGNSRNTDLDFKRLYTGEAHEINTYQVYDTLTMNAGATLTVGPGVVVKFAQGGGLTIHGALDARGIPELPVVFTSHRDDRYGGDLNLDGYGTSPANGDWRCIYLSDQAMDENCTIDHAVIRYGGSSNNGMIYSAYTDFTIKNSTLSNSSSNGINGHQADLTLTGNEIFGNSDNGIYLSYGTSTVAGCRIFANFGDGVDIRYNAGLTISASEIFGNLGNGVYSTSNQAVNADGNWWGAADGPGGQGPGSGDRISANVTCESFLTSGTDFSYFNAGPNTSEGTITGPAVTRGTDTSEFGTDDGTRMLYDLESVILEYSGLNPAWRYGIFVTYANGDDTTGVGGNHQSLTDGDGLVIQGDLQVPGAASPTQYHFPLAPSSHDDGTLQLNFNRENGYRAVISQVWLIQREDTSDTAAPGSAITSPSPGHHLAGTVFKVTGTSTDGSGCGVKSVEIGIGQGTEISWRPVTHLSGNGAWQYRWPLPGDGGYMLYSRARDRAGNLESPGTGLNVTVNNTPPAPVTGFSVYDTPTDSGGNISMVWTLSPDDGAGNNDVKSYGIERSQTPNGGFTSLGSVMAGATGYTDDTPVNGTRYYYRVASVDTAGNKRYSPVYGPVISIVNTGDTIPPEEIDGLSGIPGNEVVFLTWSPSADSALDLTDQLLEVSTDNINWNSPVSLGKETASYLVQGLTNETDYYFRIRVKDASNNTSDGARIGPVTPRATAVTTVSGTLASDTTWAAGVYYVENSLTVNQGVTLTILPGVIVKFASSRYIRVNGTLHAVGSAGNEIVFTAWTDDAHGGDSNGDGDSQGSPGYWSYLSLADTASASRLDHVLVQFAGYGTDAAIYNHSDAPIVSCRIRENAGRGIETDNSSPLIQGNIIENNGGDGLYHNYGSPRVQGNVISGNNNGIYVQYAAPAIQNNSITGNREYGIYFRNAANAPEITGNTITGNDKPVRLPFSSLPGPGAGNILSPNTHDQIEFWGNTLTRNVTLSADPVNVYYQVGGDATIAGGVRLTMDPGVIWKFGNGLSLYVRGALHAVGTPGDKIIFTSHGDDSAGGDTNGDGFSEGRPGDWRRIYFADSVIDFMARLEHTAVRYGGADGYANVYAEKANISIVSSEISHSANYGIYFYNGSPLVRDTRVSDNKDLGICQYYGSPVFRGNTVTGNGNSGLYSQQATPVIADNTITNNAGWGIYFYDAQDAPPITGNTITGNTRSMVIPASVLPGPDTPAEDENILAPNSVNGIWIRGNGRNTDLDFKRLYTGEAHEINTYQVYNTLTMNAGATLTVDPGVVVKFAKGGGLTIHGALDARGIPELPVVFTSHRDDQYGGDLNLDGYGTAPANGDWGCIYLSNQAMDENCTIDHAVIRYGGSSNNGMVYSAYTDFTIKNSTLSNSSTSGIRGHQANLTLTGNEIFGNSDNGIYLSYGSSTAAGCRIFANFGDGVDIRYNTGLTISASEIFGNLGNGVYSTSNQAVNADGNWWGAADGPGGQGPGSGDRISGNVTCDAFLTDGTEFYYYNAGGANHYGYGIPHPQVSDTASGEWGDSDPFSFLYTTEDAPITVEYMGLSPNAAYRLLITYLNKDDGNSIQTLGHINGEIIHPSMPLPTAGPVSYGFSIPGNLITGGNLTLNLDRNTGLRTLFSGMFLMKENGAENIVPAIHMTSPANGDIVEQKEILISGTASDTGSGVNTVEIGIQKTGENLQWYPATTLTGSGSWSYLWDHPSPGEYTIKARARDHSGNSATAPEVATVIVDGILPGPVTQFFGQGTSGDAGTMHLTWGLSPDDGPGENDVVRYEIFRSENPFSGFALVGQVGKGVSMFDDATVTQLVDYYYYISCVDAAGHHSDSAIFGPFRSDGSIDNTAPEDVTNLQASATQVSGTGSSVRLTWTACENTEGDLDGQFLYISTDGGISWPEKISLDKSTVNYQRTGLTAGLEHTFRITTLDEVPNESDGVQVTITPTGAETEVIALGGSLTHDTRLSAGVYHVASSLTVANGTTLILEPGAVLKFGSGVSLTVNGSLQAVGAPGTPVVFTAWTDDDHGGDSNGDGPSQGAPGYWTQLYFSESASACRIEHSVVRFAGRWGNHAINLNRAHVPVESSVIKENFHTGIYAYYCSSLIKDNTIEKNGSHGLYLNYGSPRVQGNTLNENDYGIYVRYAAPAIENNTITNNTGYGIYYYNAGNAPAITGNTITGNLFSILVPASSLPDDTNVLTPNTNNYIGVRGNGIPADTVLKVWGKGTQDEVGTYVVYSSDFTVPAHTRLTVEPGVILKFDAGLGMVVNGSLAADGTLGEQIVFTALTDDLYGGDTNGDGFNSTPVNGAWDGITFNDSFFEDRNHLNHVKVRYAGANGSGGVYLHYADALIENSEISNSSTNGIRVYGASPTLNGNTLWGNRLDGIRLEYCPGAGITFNSISSNLGDGINIQGNSQAVATNNLIFMNRGFGLRNTTGNPIDATQTWWGDADAGGPLQSATNPDGTGSQVSDNVVYEPWQTTVATQFSYVNFSQASGSAYGTMAPPVLAQGYLSDIWGSEPDKSMAWANETNGEAVIVDYTGLDTGKRYKVRVSYYNSDPNGSVQSLTDGNGVRLHGSLNMPSSGPVQYEFSIPTASYAADGTLGLKFLHDNPDTSIRVSVAEIWLMEDIPELTPPRFTGLGYNDVDGSGTLSQGDEFYFHFSEEMDTSLIKDGTTDADQRLVPEGGLGYGTVNQCRWTPDNKTLIVTLTPGFSVTGTEKILPDGLTDLFGNEAVGSQSLTLSDSIAPQFTGIQWIDLDANGTISPGDRYLFHFDESMDVTVIKDGTQEANIYMRPTGGLTYGDLNTVTWSSDGRELGVMLTQGFTVLGDEMVIPSNFVTDMAGNSVTGSHALQGRDTIPPTITGIHFDDADGSGTVSIGDRYRFDFSEPLRPAALSNHTTEANSNLSPSGQSYGTLNRISWNGDFTGVTIEITPGFTVAGNETVTPSSLVTDRAGNPVANTIDLVTTDDMVPGITVVKANYICPVSASNNYRVMVQFDSAMDASADPTITLTSTGGTSPAVPGGGTWMTTLYTNDTFITPDIVLAQGMDGTLSISVDHARDWAGNPMVLAGNVFTCELDATPPANPEVTGISPTCNGVILSWPGYSAPADLAGFQIYCTTSGAFDTVDGVSFSKLAAPSARAFTMDGLELKKQYHLAVAAMDRLGNITGTVVSHPVYIDQPTPPLPAITVVPGSDPDTAMVSWAGYDSSLCGFTGFRVYLEEQDFTSVEGLTPVALLEKSARQYALDGLDRKKIYHIAVVGINRSGEYTDTGSAAVWSDPYAEVITEDMVIGGGEQKEITIYAGMTILNNAALTIEPGTTLFFEQGAGISVGQGKILAEGTALDPVIMTSKAAAPGGWSGITIQEGDTGSVLRHVVIEYGRGLRIDNASPQVEAFTARFNSGPGLLVENSGTLATSHALLVYNDVGAELASFATLAINDSVIKNNTTNAASDGSQTMDARNNWWGALEEAGIIGTVTGGVDYSGFLDHEPVLTPALGTKTGSTRFSILDIDLKLADRNAEEMRLSENSTFADVFFDPFMPETTFTLSPIAGGKRIFAQFKSATGTLSEPVSITVEYVADGPEINGFSLAEGQIIHRPVEVTGSASAPLGISDLEFHVDNVPIYSGASDSISYQWDIRDLSPDTYRVKLMAHDNGGNLSAVERNVIVDPLPPPAPQISEPADGTALAGGPVVVRGSAEPLADVKLTRNGFVMDTVRAGADGRFEISDVDLQEGNNRLIATSKDRVGISPNSNIITVVLDSGPPEAPVLENVQVRPGGGVSLGWKPSPDGETPDFYRIYRGSVSFTDPAGATLVDDHVTGTGFTDSGLPDGLYFYGVAAVDRAGNASGLSNLLSIEYDGTAPVFGITYDQAMPCGVGTLGITLTTSEPLAAIPGLTIRPAGANTPAAIGLTRVDARTFTGSFEILSGTGTGPAPVKVSGTDLAGNTVTGSPAGPDLVIDTDGPLGSLTAGLPAPVQVKDPVNLDITLDLTEAPKTGTTPLVRFIPPSGDTVTLSLTGSGTRWTGVLPLAPAMGSGVGTFTLMAFDELGNESTVITAGKSLEIYNTDLPDPTAPVPWITASALANGVIQLKWAPVDKAETYTLYRKSGTCDSGPDTLVADSLTELSYQDLPPQDGTYCYAVRTNLRGSESDLSSGAQAVSDRLPPLGPVNVAAGLGSVGVRISWDPPETGEPVARYVVYRNGSRIGTVAQGGAGRHELLDYPASGGSYDYVVASADAVGNENPAAPVTFDLAVGAVTGLQAFVINDNVPLLTWSSTDSSTVGYNIYRSGIKLNDTLLTEPSFEDLLYAGSSKVTYAVSAVNGGNDESPLRTVEIFPLDISALANPDESGDPGPLVTNSFSRLDVTLMNNEASSPLTIDGLQVRMTVNGQETYALDRDLSRTINENTAHVETVALPVGLTLNDRLVKIRAVRRDLGGSEVIYQRDLVFDNVINPSFNVSMNIGQVPLAGGLATIQVCVRNNGYLDMDVVVSRKNGTEPGDIHVAVENSEGLEISRGDYLGYPPGTRISNGNGYVRIAPGDSLCVDVEVLVPESLSQGDVISFNGIVDSFTYDTAGDALSGAGSLTGSMASGITLSEYFGTALAGQDTYANDETVVITGQAIDRETGQPRPDTPLKLGFHLKGFTWYEEVISDSEGNFTHEYQPGPGISGQFTVWAAHPDVFDIIDQDRFSFYRMYASPSEATIRSSKADVLDFVISLVNPGDMPLSHFTMAFSASTLDAADEEIPVDTLHGEAIFPDGFTLPPGETRTVTLKLRADGDAPDDAQVVYRLISAQGAASVFSGSVSLVPAVPVLTMTEPGTGYVEASIDRGVIKTVPVTVKNQGLMDLTDATMALPGDLPWITTNLPRNSQGAVDLGDIKVGESRTFDVIIAPPGDTEFGDYNDKFVITGSNSVQEFNVNVYPLITSHLEGSAMFTVTNSIEQPVKDATVRIFNNTIHEQVISPETDLNGQVTLYGLGIGSWTYQITAPGHNSVSGVVDIVGDQTVLVEEVLNKNLVTVTFNVEPVAFTDRYEIKIEQTFETHVPMPVIMFDTPYIDFGTVEPGFTTTIIANLSNYGLKAVDDVTLSVFDNGASRMEPLVTYLPRLNAMETVEIPIRFTYRGQDALLPGNAVSNCASAVFDPSDFIRGLAAIGARGVANCGVSPTGAAVGCSLIAGWAIASGVAGVEAIVGTLAQFAGCIVGSFFDIGGGGGGGGDHAKYSVGTGGKGCFTAGSPVRMADGSRRPIGTVRPGDRVMAWDGGTARISEVYTRESDHVLEIQYTHFTGDGTVARGRLETTDEHLFWSLRKKRWVAAGELASGEILSMPDNGRAEITTIRRTPTPATVYSLDVEGYESFYVNGVLVRQKCGKAEETGMEERLRAFLYDEETADPERGDE